METVGDEETQERLEIREAKIPAGTIVVNINACREEYADSCIYHECIHYELHDLFFKLQEIGRSDLEGVKTRKKTIRSDERISDPLYFMEKQASRGADCMMLPATWLRENIGREKLTQEQFAEKLEISRKTLVHIEHGEAAPSLATLHLFFLKSGMTPNELFCETAEKTDQERILRMTEMMNEDEKRRFF